jgi:hypothetical protein
MQQVVLDSATRSQLGGLTRLSELRDENGQLLGHYVPAAGTIVAEAGECPFTEGEIEELRQQTGGRSLREIWRDLGRS